MFLLDIVLIPLILYFGHLVVNETVRRFNIPDQRPFLMKLYYFHVLFAILYGAYVKIFGGDAIGYWYNVSRYMAMRSSWLEMHEPGTLFIFFLTYPLATVLDLSYWTGILLFSQFGFMGFIFLYLTIRRSLNYNPTLFGYPLFPAVLFLPNMHFWSGGIGKDTLIFFALSLFIFSMTNIRRNIPGLIFSFYLIFYIRPHIALLVLVGFAVSMAVSTKGGSFFWRAVFVAVAVAVYFVVASTVFEFIGLEEESLESIDEVASIKSKYLSRSQVGSAIDLKNYSTGMKIFTFLYRPLFFDAGNIFGLVVSLENGFYFLLTLMILRFRNLARIVSMPAHLKACLFIVGSTAFFMSSSLSNLGIVIRQKNMVMFMFILVAMYLIGQEQEASLPKSSRPAIPQNPHAKAKTA